MWSIAERELGAGARYEELYRKNRCVIGENYDQLYPGMRLKSKRERIDKGCNAFFGMEDFMEKI